jgi:hypothetical protein
MNPAKQSRWKIFFRKLDQVVSEEPYKGSSKGATRLLHRLAQEATDDLVLELYLVNQETGQPASRPSLSLRGKVTEYSLDKWTKRP